MGKTTLVNEFSREFENYIHLNLERENEAGQVVAQELKVLSNDHYIQHFFMDLSPGNIAVRVWSEPYSIDRVTTPKGKDFRLINLPFYYVNCLPFILQSIALCSFEQKNATLTL